jgi:hypothetical protein
LWKGEVEEDEDEEEDDKEDYDDEDDEEAKEDEEEEGDEEKDEKRENEKEEQHLLQGYMLNPNTASNDDNYELSGGDDDSNEDDEEEDLARTVTERVDHAAHTGGLNLGSTQVGILSAYQLPGCKAGIVVPGKGQRRKRHYGHQ